ncbi:MAG: hypothetical protein PHV32_08550 [Eubacteriales bacterium]|nr:hypothetical protein [Eubacteriales bacterium]
MKSIMIRPIYPVLPNNPTRFSSDTTLSILTYTAFLIAVGTIAFLLSLYASNHFKGDKKKTAVAFVGIALAVSILIDNIFLLPVLSVALALLPFFYTLFCNTKRYVLCGMVSPLHFFIAPCVSVYN